jgi:aryl-alcohol dehydrogenase-like predicted oxidoreductase
MDVSVIAFGGAEIGYENADQAVVDRLLNGALDSGVNVVDTGECYGESETKIGTALSSRRSEYFLFTKAGHASGLEGEDWTRDVIRDGVDRSLRRLKTSYVDLLQLHSCSSAVLERGEVTRALQDARDAGKVRFIGYSGDGLDAVAAIRMGIFDTLQTSVNLADQEAISVSIPLATQVGMGVLAKRSLANAVWKYPERPENPYHHEYWNRLNEIDYLFLRTTSLADSVATALRFTLSVPGVATAIVGSKSEERFRENLGIVPPSVLPRDQYEVIRNIWKERASPTWVGQV